MDDDAIVYTVDKNPELVEQLRKDLPIVTAKVVDITHWEEVRKLLESFGPMDYLVNNAGILKSQAFLDITEEEASRYWIWFNYENIS